MFSSSIWLMFWKGNPPISTLLLLPIGRRDFPMYKYVSRRTNPSALLKVTVPLLSANVTEMLPSGSPRGLPSAATCAYRSILIGKGTDPVTMELEKSLGASKSFPGHTHVQRSNGLGFSVVLSQTGLPLAHKGQSHEPHANRSKFPFVQPMIS